jgi:phenylpropionate dioxygenase-like ring-hydroxylating dioxygenase large terminal subunit
MTEPTVRSGRGDATADAAPGATTEQGQRATLHSSGMREAIPAGGLREYWYPLIPDADVPRGKPVKRTLLGVDLALFRGKSGQVTAVVDACPHRGASLSGGSSHWRGTITCPYHGWTFDEGGHCLAVLGEGPESRIPGMASADVATYPTRTLKGLVFVWMGRRDPAPIEEDVPEQFFRPDALVQVTERIWNCNWRPAVENLLDAHVYYVHRNSVQLLLLPARNLIGMTKMGPRRPRPSVINGRALSYSSGELSFLDDFVGMDHPGKLHGNGDGTPADRPELKTNFQDTYPLLGGVKWPKTKARLYFGQVVEKIKGLHRRPPVASISDEWQDFHLPTTYQVDYPDHIYSRVTVPISEDQSRIFYFHTTTPPSGRDRLFDTWFWRLWYRWQMVDNFSAQDGEVVQAQRYDLPEKLSATDTFPLAMRRFILEYGRDFQDEGTD